MQLACCRKEEREKGRRERKQEKKREEKRGEIKERETKLKTNIGKGRERNIKVILRSCPSLVQLAQDKQLTS